MARKDDFLKGVTIEQLLNMTGQEFRKFDESQKRIIISRMASAANKRIRRAQAKGKTSPAIDYAMRTGGLFSSKGKKEDELKKERQRIINFMRNKTSTAKGADEFRQNVIDGLSKRGVIITYDQYEEFWNLYGMLKRRDPSVEMRTIKYVAMGELVDYMQTNLTTDEIISYMKRRVREIYEKQREEDVDDMSEFFDAQ